jgi:hypothetical protein
LCSKKIPQTTVTSLKDESVEALDRYNSLLAIDLLFDSDFTLADLYKEDGEVVNVLGAVNHNARLWEPQGAKDPLTGVRDSRLPEALPEEILYGPRRYEGLRVRDRARVGSRFPTAPTTPHPTKYLVEMYKSASEVEWLLD